MLTEAQQVEVVRLRGYVATIARSFRKRGYHCASVSEQWDDDYMGEAMLACCEAVLSWVPERCPLDQWVGRVVWTRLARFTTYLERRHMLHFVSSDGPKGRGCSRDPGHQPNMGNANGGYPVKLPSAPATPPPVYDCIEKLPPLLKPVAVASWVDGQSISEISRVLGLPERKVKLKLTRAKEALLRLLDDTP